MIETPTDELTHEQRSELRLRCREALKRLPASRGIAINAFELLALLDQLDAAEFAAQEWSARCVLAEACAPENC